jgi:hypothetical protein
MINWSLIGIDGFPGVVLSRKDTMKVPPGFLRNYLIWKCLDGLIALLVQTG